MHTVEKHQYMNGYVLHVGLDQECIIPNNPLMKCPGLNSQSMN